MLEWILTKDEEARIIEHEIARMKQHAEWKMTESNLLSKQEALLRISQTDWHTQMNKAEVLYRANANKHYGIWQQQQREAEKAEAEEKSNRLKQTWNAGCFYKLIKWASEVEYGKPLIVNQDTLGIIKPICYFLSGDERFKTELGLDPRKGIALRGAVGVGKTHIIKCASQNELHPIYITSMLEIASEVKAEGEYDLPQGYSKFYIDDVGSEEHIQNHFGTKINWFKNFIETYYLRNQHYNRLIISTNNTAQQIEEKYGFRVRSRFKDMFNVVDVTGKDLRG